MEQYRKNRTGAIVEAVQLDASNVEEVARWCNGEPVVEEDALNPEETYVGLNFKGIRERQRLSAGNWLVKTSTNWFHAVPDHEFRSNFEPLTTVEEKSDPEPYHPTVDTYDTFTVQQLKDEIDLRNSTRDDDSKISKKGNKPELIKALRADD